MKEEIEKFAAELKTKKGVSDNSLAAYIADISEFAALAQKRGIQELSQAGEAEVVSYVMSLKQENKAASTIKRKLASLRNFYSYLVKNGTIKENPISGIKSPKTVRKEIEYLQLDELEGVFKLPFTGVKGIRDKAMIELLYATGIRVREFVELRLCDVNLKLGFITCTGEFGKARIIPMGTYCKKAIDDYLNEARPKLVSKGTDDENTDESSTSQEALFLNRMGKQMTRQGIWKILKEYSNAAGLGDKLTPQTLRNSFAAHMIQNGADLKSLQELMGHEDATATQIYLSLTKNRIKDVYDRTHPRA
ncbi:MAG: tyrosine-type recombinase/integrase [Clostridiales bacterium]|nr:tyrosine-type recombinase/integrase [Clostridiales bacterium]